MAAEADTDRGCRVWRCRIVAGCGGEGSAAQNQVAAYDVDVCARPPIGPPYAATRSSDPKTKTYYRGLNNNKNRFWGPIILYL